MDAEQLRLVVQTAVSSALAEQAKAYQPLVDKVYHCYHSK